MDDQQIVDLYWNRSENAISETSKKYGNYCHYIAYHILHSREDSEECVNDTYLKAWNSMPPKRPEKLSAFLGKITRNLSLHRYEQYNALKRGAGQVPLALEELNDCIPSQNNVEPVVDDIVLTEILNRFLGSLPPETRKFFVQRYWYLMSIKEIASDCQVTESKVKVTLFRTRNELKEVLAKGGIVL